MNHNNDLLGSNGNNTSVFDEETYDNEVSAEFSSESRISETIVTDYDNEHAINGSTENDGRDNSLQMPHTNRTMLVSDSSPRPKHSFHLTNGTLSTAEEQVLV